MTQRLTIALLVLLSFTCAASANPIAPLLSSDEGFNLSEPEVDDSAKVPTKRGKPAKGPSEEQRKTSSTPAVKRSPRSIPPAVKERFDKYSKLKDSQSPQTQPTMPAASPQVRSKELAFELLESDPEASAFFSGPIPRTAAIASDASLNDFCSVGELAWAVGERGVICFSDDAGTTWTTQVTPFECSLNSVCFLTNTIGWVGGTRIVPGSNPQLLAVLMSTRDGGKSWIDLTKNSPPAAVRTDNVSAAGLPGIVHLQYFGLESAIAVTAPMRSRNGHAVFSSDDGGLTWSPISSDQSAGPWLGAHFVSESDGIIVGQHQSYAAVVADHAEVINHPEPTLRAIRAVSLDGNAQGWIAGDGAFLLTTNDAGVTWKAPAGEITRDVAETMDFHVVAHEGSTIILGGEPGSCLLRSSDNGQSWKLVSLPLNGRLNRVRFLSETEAIGVGSLGQIVKSSDGGISWQAVRSSGFRTGVLNMMTDADKASWHLLSSVSGEQGVRAVAVQISQPLSLEGDALLDGVPMSEQCTAAVTQLGGNETSSHWMFPRTKPEHHRSSEQLVTEWNRQNDGQLRKLLPLRIARDIRNWRPSVIVIEAASNDDAIATILREVMPLAVSIASDDQANGTQLSQLGLQPWTLDRVVIRVPQDESATLTYRDDDLLPSLGTTSGLLQDATQRLFTRPIDTTSTLPAESGYELLTDSSSKTSVANLFDGIYENLKSDARRANHVRSRDQIQTLQRTLQTSHIESTALNGHMQLAQTEDALVGQLYGIGANLPATLAMKQLRDLAEINLQQNNMEGYLAVQQEILRRHPTSEEAQSAAEMLLLFYSSAEARHYRLKAVNAKATATATVGSALSGAPNNTSGSAESPLSVQPRIQPPSTSPFASGATDAMAALHQRWDSHAMTAFEILSNVSRNKRPETLNPMVQLRIAANYRLQQKNGEQATLLSELSQRDDQYALFARCEMQVDNMPSAPLLPLINLPKRSERPFLDGVLTDSIWEDSQEIQLSPFMRDALDPATGTPRKLVTQANGVSSLTMLAWDGEFFYLAAVLERAPEKSDPIELVMNRTYDSEHEDRDRLELEIDTDRDFGTTFQLSVDESGKTSDRCWMLDKWNPKWFVALDADDTTWRVEAAIPLSELSANGAKPGDLWNIRLRRVIPGVLQHELQTGTNPVSTDGAGMVRFIRPRNKAKASKK